MELATGADIGVAIATLVLACFTALTVKEMHKQKNLDKLHNEMTLLVGQLYSLGLEDFEYRRYLDWGIILTYMHFTTPDLRSAIQNFLVAKEAYSRDETSKSKKERLDNLEQAMIIEIKRRYKNLIDEIDKLEKRSWWKLWD